MIPLRDSQPSYSTPVVTAALIAVNVLVFLYEMSLDRFSLNHFVEVYGVTPSDWTLGGLPAALVSHGHTLVTSMFVHGGWLHLIGNMWFLWIYGDNVEDVLGRARYLLFYLSCGVLAAVGHIALSFGSHVPTIGASGAIAGVMGAYLIKFPRSRITTLVWVLVFVTVVDIPATLILVYWLIIQVASSVTSLGYSAASQGGTAWFAHVGGFLAGMGLILVMRTHRRYRRNRQLHW